MKKKVIGIDLGGTKIAGIICDINGKNARFLQIPTRAKKGRQFVLEQIFALIKELKGHTPARAIKAVGVGAPGEVLAGKGIVNYPPNLPGWKRVNLKKIIERRTGIRTVVDNDANAAALGELKFGAGRGFKNFLYITVSTGIGGGMIMDGKLYHGSDGTAGEIGHTNTGEKELRCSCGRIGCLEAYASGTGMRKLAKLRLQRDLDSKALAKLAKAGNSGAKKVIAEAGRFLGIAFANYINIMNPQAIIIGGGVVKMGALLFDPIRKTIKQYALKVPLSRVKVLTAKLGDKVGVWGAVALGL